MRHPLLLLVLAVAHLGAAEDGAAFRAACAAAAAGDGLSVAGADGMLFERSELRFCSYERFWGDAAAAVSRAPSPAKADPLAAIVAIAGEFQRHGVQVILAPVPPKAVIHPTRVPGAPAAAMPAVALAPIAAFAAELGRAGVPVLDLAPTLLAIEAGGAQAYCRTDSHWSPAGVRAVAATLAAEVRARTGAAAPAAAWPARDEQRPLRGDLRPEADGPTETLPAWVVTPPAGATTAPDSPVLVIGDSHCLVFHIGEDLHGTGAGLPDHLAAALAAPVDVVAVRGADACSPLLNIARRARKDPAWLAGKRVVVWTFAARAFTEAANGWSMIPLSKR